MITELILSGLFGIADIFLGLLPSIEWTIDTSSWSFLTDILSMICYLLPFETIINIGSAILALAFFRLNIAIIRFILGLIPFVG